MAKLVRRHIAVADKAARTYAGKVYASKREATRAMELTIAQRAGLIRDLKTQVRFPIVINGKKIGRGYWKADFTYEERLARPNGIGWAPIVEDCHQVTTRESKLRIELVEALHGLKVRIT